MNGLDVNVSEEKIVERLSQYDKDTNGSIDFNEVDLLGNDYDQKNLNFFFSFLD